jgi:hypothetical protein
MRRGARRPRGAAGATGRGGGGGADPGLRAIGGPEGRWRARCSPLSRPRGARPHGRLGARAGQRPGRFLVAQCGEGDDGVEAAAEGIGPCASGGRGMVRVGEHVFENLGGGSDGRAGVQEVLQHGRNESGAVVHLRIVAPREKAEPALDVLESCPTVINVIYLREAADKPDGDVLLCDVAREDASVVIEDLRALEIHRAGLHRGRARRHGRLGCRRPGATTRCRTRSPRRLLRRLRRVLCRRSPGCRRWPPRSPYSDWSSFRGSLGQLDDRRRRPARRGNADPRRAARGLRPPASGACPPQGDAAAPGPPHPRARRGAPKPRRPRRSNARLPGPPLSAAAGGRPRTGCRPGR